MPPVKKLMQGLQSMNWIYVEIFINKYQYIKKHQYINGDGQVDPRYTLMLDKGIFVRDKIFPRSAFIPSSNQTKYPSNCL